MRHEQDFDYLVRLIYQPRVLIYGLSVVITISRARYEDLSLPVTSLCLWLVIYPHLVFWITGWLGGGPGPARYSLLADGVMAGLLILANHLHLLAALSFITALVMSTLVVSGPRILSGNSIIVAFMVIAGFDYLDAHPYRANQPLTDALSACALVLYSGLIGHIGFKEMMALINGHSRVNEQRHRLAGVTNRLSKYVSPQIYSSLAGTESNVTARRKRLTVFFSDIEGFTRLMERLDEEMITHLLNEYLDDMAAIALAHGGTVDKFMGDGVMVFFGDPVSRGAATDALACVRMAIAMRERLDLLRQKWHGDLHIRIGIHTGYCAVGNFGSEHRMDYTIVGSTVNLASRLENHAGRDEILISRDTWALVAREVICVPGARIRVKGIVQPVEVYTVQNGKVHNEHDRIHSGPHQDGIAGVSEDRPVIRLLKSTNDLLP